MARTILVPRGVRSECFSGLWIRGASHRETSVTGSISILNLSIGVWTMPGSSRHAISRRPHLSTSAAIVWGVLRKMPNSSATRYETLQETYHALLTIACILFWL
jgi:hypothetical protein